jgi:hypothetical protein
MVLFGSQAFAALLWGILAAPLGLVPTFLLAAAAMAAAALSMRLRPLADTSAMDRSTVLYWPESSLVVDLDPASGPVVVKTVNTIAPEHEQRFLKAMADLRLMRLRTGATQWGLYPDGETAHQFIELFVVAS